jgi:hypothetical protein
MPQVFRGVSSIASAGGPLAQQIAERIQVSHQRESGDATSAIEAMPLEFDLTLERFPTMRGRHHFSPFRAGRPARRGLKPSRRSVRAGGRVMRPASHPMRRCIRVLGVSAKHFCAGDSSFNARCR